MRKYGNVASMLLGTKLQNKLRYFSELVPSSSPSILLLLVPNSSTVKVICLFPGRQKLYFNFKKGGWGGEARGRRKGKKSITKRCWQGFPTQSKSALKMVLVFTYLVSYSGMICCPYYPPFSSICVQARRLL